MKWGQMRSHVRCECFLSLCLLCDDVFLYFLEFRLSLTSDKNRIEQLLGSVANKCHPMSKFMWGSYSCLVRYVSYVSYTAYNKLLQVIMISLHFIHF